MSLPTYDIKCGFIAQGENSLMTNGTRDKKKQKTREMREQVAHPYITKQHLKPPFSKEENASEGERVKTPKPCDWIDKFLYF